VVANYKVDKRFDLAITVSSLTFNDARTRGTASERRLHPTKSSQDGRDSIGVAGTPRGRTPVSCAQLTRLDPLTPTISRVIP